MRTSNGANFYKNSNSISILFWFFSYDIKKEKTKLTHLFRHLFQFLQLFNSTQFYLYILDREDKDRTELFVLQ